MCINCFAAVQYPCSVCCLCVSVNMNKNSPTGSGRGDALDRNSMKLFSASHPLPLNHTYNAHGGDGLILNGNSTDNHWGSVQGDLNHGGHQLFDIKLFVRQHHNEIATPLTVISKIVTIVTLKPIETNLKTLQLSPKLRLVQRKHRRATTCICSIGLQLFIEHQELLLLFPHELLGLADRGHRTTEGGTQGVVAEVFAKTQMFRA